MEYLAINVKTQTSTFRIPEFQNFHKSYFLPPPTTLMGLAGAAMKLSPKETQDFFDSAKFDMGVFGISQGKAKDLWKYRTLESKGLVGSSIISKEIWFLNNYFIVYGAADHLLIDKLRSSFLHPGYALTLGSSDSLAKATVIEQFELSESTDVEHCILEGNIIEEVFENSDNNLGFSLYTTREPISCHLPVRFEYESDYGVRRVIKRKEFSFIGKKMKLNVSKKGVKIGDIFVPLFSVV